MKDTVVINILGGPGVGKTTLAAELFTRLKIMGYEVENVSEFAKELVWEERSQAFNDRLYMHAEQNHRLLMMQGKLDFIITDSPLILTSVYNSFYLKNVHSDSYNDMIDLMVKETWNLYDNRVFLLERNNDYHALGRRESENEAKIIDNYLLAYLIQNNISYTTIKDRNNAVHEILEGLRLV
ncbi:MAG: ATP-binding protein [Erysipelotrichaceae bacterium]|nr:ATP-binding protein [Erysipelotrichaceae bacterium]